ALRGRGVAGQERWVERDRARPLSRLPEQVAQDLDDLELSGGLALDLPELADRELALAGGQEVEALGEVGGSARPPSAAVTAAGPGEGDARDDPRGRREGRGPERAVRHGEGGRTTPTPAPAPSPSPRAPTTGPTHPRRP